jgi:hypothetical protein
VPSHHGAGLDEHEWRAPAPPRLRQDYPKQPVARPEMRPGAPAFECVELLAEREVLEDQFAMAATGQSQRTNDNKDDFQHPSILAAYEERSNPPRSRL